MLGLVRSSLTATTRSAATRAGGARLRLMSAGSDLPQVFFDVAIDGEGVGKIIFELRPDVVPRTAGNFLSLCRGDQGLTYKGSHFHRIIPQFMLQGGDITHGNGTGGESIYGRHFADENFELRHTEPGLLSMANAGPNTNGSQFFITTVPCHWLDGKHTVFGKVVRGMELVQTIEACGSESGQPSKHVVITNCGSVDDVKEQVSR